MRVYLFISKILLILLNFPQANAVDYDLGDHEGFKTRTCQEILIFVSQTVGVSPALTCKQYGSDYVATGTNDHYQQCLNFEAARVALDCPFDKFGDPYFIIPDWNEYVNGSKKWSDYSNTSCTDVFAFLAYTRAKSYSTYHCLDYPTGYTGEFSTHYSACLQKKNYASTLNCHFSDEDIKTASKAYDAASPPSFPVPDWNLYVNGSKTWSDYQTTNCTDVFAFLAYTKQNANSATHCYDYPTNYAGSFSTHYSKCSEFLLAAETSSCPFTKLEVQNASLKYDDSLVIFPAPDWNNYINGAKTWAQYSKTSCNDIFAFLAYTKQNSSSTEHCLDYPDSYTGTNTSHFSACQTFKKARTDVNCTFTDFEINLASKKLDSSITPPNDGGGTDPIDGGTDPIDGGETNPPEVSTLTYEHGGNASSDPCKDSDYRCCFYVDPKSGSDSKSGESSAEPFLTVNAAITAAKAIKDPSLGIMILVKKVVGHEKDVSITGLKGSAQRPVVLGSYGSSATIWAGIGKLVLNNVSYMTIRDLVLTKLTAEEKLRNSLIYSNVVRGSSANGIFVLKGSMYVTIANNFVYDIDTQDGISIHDSNWSGGNYTESGPHHWIINNFVMGSGNMEDGIDVARAHTRYSFDGKIDKGSNYLVESRYLRVASDIKIIGNNLQMEATKFASDPFGRGYVQKYTGASKMGINSGHMGDFSWIYRNITTGSRTSGIQLMNDIKTNSYNENTRQNGIMAENIIFNSVTKDGWSSLRAYQKDVLVENNTIIRWNQNGGAAIQASLGGYDMKAVNNFISVNLGTTTDFSVASGLRASASSNTVEDSRSNKSFTLPSSSYKDPRTWTKQSFKNYFIPKGSNCTGTPKGALKCDGNFKTSTFKAFVLSADKDNYGHTDFSIANSAPNSAGTTYRAGDSYCGWEGLPIVKLRYGVTCQK